MLISHTNIRHDVLHTELAYALLDPDGQVFPWRDLYPLAGQSVYADGQFWTIFAKESGVLADRSHVQLCRIGQVNGDERETLTTTRGACRPVSWTQDDEDVFGDHDARHFHSGHRGSCGTLTCQAQNERESR